MYLKIGKDWQSVDITGAPVMQVRSGKVLFSDEESPPASDKDALIVAKHEVKIANRKVVHLKTAENNQRESEVVFSAMVESDSSEGGGGGEGNTRIAIHRASVSINMPSNVSGDIKKDKAFIQTASSALWKSYVAPAEITDVSNLLSASAEIRSLPCNAGKDFLPFNVSVRISNPNYIYVYLAITGNASQSLDILTGEYRPLGLVDGIQYDPLVNVYYSYQMKEE